MLSKLFFILLYILLIFVSFFILLIFIKKKTNTYINEISKLKKENKNLKLDLDDEQDNSSQFKRQLADKRSELDSLRNKLEETEKDNRTISLSLDSIKKDLYTKQEETSQKDNSLTFVKEILLAKSVSDKDTAALNQNIDSFVGFVKDELLPYIKEISSDENNTETLTDGLAEWAITKKKDWLNSKTTIAFIGEFSAGKTSIVNMLLAEYNKEIPLLPVSTKATTAIPTYITGSNVTKNPQYYFYTPDNKLKTISENIFKQVNKSTLEQVQGISNLIRYFVMKYPNPNLAHLSILDTPGFSSNDKEDEKRTIEVINECDALFWVFDVNTGTVNKSSLSAIKENLKKPLYIIINKVDTKSKTETESVRQQVTKIFNKNNIEVKKIILFSKENNELLISLIEELKSIKHNDITEKYISNLEDKIKSICEEYQTELNESYKSYMDAKKEVTAKQFEFMKLLAQMKNTVSDIDTMPEKRKHGFVHKEDSYDMSSYQKEKFDDLVESLTTKMIPASKESFDLIAEAEKKFQQAYTKYIDMQAKQNGLKFLQEKLRKQIQCFEI